MSSHISLRLFVNDPLWDVYKYITNFSATAEHSLASNSGSSSPIASCLVTIDINGRLSYKLMQWIEISAEAKNVEIFVDIQQKRSKQESAKKFFFSANEF